MKHKIIYTVFFLFSLMVEAQLNPQSKKITEKFFPEFEALEDITPALNKKRGFTDYRELMAYLVKYEDKYPEHVTIQMIGESQKGKSIPMVYISNPNNEDKIKVWMQGGLHGNEPASTEALLYLLDKLLTDDSYNYLLDRIAIKMVPMANIDGYEKQDRYAANGLDLNRDQTKLMAQESVALKKAFSEFNPEVGMDFHEYRPYRRDFAKLSSFGITSAFDAMFLYSGNLNVPENIRKLTNELFVENAREALNDHNYLHHDYVSTDEYGGEVHFNQGSNNARSSATSYALNNTISTLFEIRGVGIGRTSFKRRIHTGFVIAISYLETAYEHMEAIKSELTIAQTSKADAIVTSERTVYEDTIKTIDLDSNDYIELEATFRDAGQMQAKLIRERPKAYIISASQEKLIKKLKALGSQVEILSEPTTLEVQTYNVIAYDRDDMPYEKMNRQTVKTELSIENISFPSGTFIIPMNQRQSNLIIEVLEPEAPNSFVSFGVLETDKGEQLPIYRQLN
ncbi:M14 family zinc carboxypeptidase [Psychroserpens sp. BH13MA-6]